MTYDVDDLGEQAFWDVWLGFRMGRDPRTGKEAVLASLSLGGFMLIDPADQTSFQVMTGRHVPNGGWWAIGQAPDGTIYQTGVLARKPPIPLFRWKGQGDRSEVAAELPGVSFFTLDVGPDGTVYLPEYGQNVMYAFHPDTGTVENLGDYARFGAHIRNVFCAKDGWVYVTCTDYTKSTIVGMDPRTREKKDMGESPGKSGPWPQCLGDICKDAEGHVLIPQKRWGQHLWFELEGGKPVPIDPMSVRLAHTDTGFSSLAFSDGRYVKKIEGRSVHGIDPAGNASSFEVNRTESPLRIFSIYPAGGKIWGGTFIPLTLFSFDPATGRTEYFGNPTETDGEIYSMAFSRDKLFLGSYYGAHLTRYQPGKPWKKDKTLSANPAHLGIMKEDGLSLQRPYGATLDKAGTVYFSAHGGYGCEDSGIARINPDTEDVTRWIYPNTTFGAMIYLPQRDQLLTVEHRKGETKNIRLTFIEPHTGHIAESIPLIADDGGITSLLTDGGDRVYGMHAHRATLFAYSLKERKIVKAIPEMGLGDNCNNCLIFGPDGRIWGLTVNCLFAAERDLSRFEKVADYEDHAGLNGNRFGLCMGPDGHVYFPNGLHLMRIRGKA